MSRLLYLDCFSGASGDMLLGALLGVGVPFAEIQRAVDSLGLDGVQIGHDHVDRSGIGATKFRVGGSAATDASPGHHAHDHHHHHGHDHGHSHGHDHDHDHQHEPGAPGSHAAVAAGGGAHGHRGLAEIVAIVERSSLSVTAKARAVRLFRRLAEVEAGIHRMPVEAVALHEVGAVDSIVDIVGSVRALEWLAPDRIIASPLNVGSGTVVCAHGELPVPAPATTELLVGVPIYASGPAVELVTPTGALLVTDYADGYGSLPPMRVAAVGYGAGDRDLPGRPNVLRAMLGEASAPDGLERVVVLECQIDDMNPQIYGVLMERLAAAGALDVFYAPIQMKKNRPGTLVTVVAPPDRRDTLAGILFTESTTIGVRVTETARERLDREVVAIETPIGTVRIKVARRAGAVVNAAPEFDDCARLAVAAGLSVKAAQAVVMKAWLEHADASAPSGS